MSVPPDKPQTTATTSCPSRAGRFKVSKAARKEVRRAVELAEELGLHSVTVRGVVWTLRHSDARKGFGSALRVRGDEDAANAAPPERLDDMEVPEREPRPSNRKERRSQARLEASSFQEREAARARRAAAANRATPTVPPTVASLADGATLAQAQPVRMDDENPRERAGVTEGDRSSAPAEPSAAEQGGTLSADEPAAGQGSNLSAERPSAQDLGRTPPNKSRRKEPKKPARRRIETECEAAASSAESPRVRATLHWGAQQL